MRKVKEKKEIDLRSYFEFDRVLNLKPDGLNLVDQELIFLEFADDYVAFRWGINPSACRLNKEVLSGYFQNLNDDEILLVDQVFHKHKFKKIAFDSAARSNFIRVVEMKFADDEMTIDGVDKAFGGHLVMKFSFESFRTKLVKVAKKDECFDTCGFVNSNNMFFSMNDFENCLAPECENFDKFKTEE